MKKSTIEEIEKEIDEKTKLPYEIKDKIKKEVFTNIVVATIIIMYFIFIVLGSVGTVKNARTIDLNIFSVLFLTIAIILFEIAYRKDKGNLAIYGIESLIVAIFTLFLPYIIFELDETYKKYYLMASIYIAIYYILKSIYISTKIKSKYMNSISDVKEIVKKEKSKRKVKDSTEELDEERIIKESNKKLKKGRNETNKKEEKKTEEPKRRGRPKREAKPKDVKEEKDKKSETKRRGRPKKIENKQMKDEVKENKTPKKRGRPRKVVANND